MNTETLLLELGTEELPPKQLTSLAQQFAQNFTRLLHTSNIMHGTVEWFATPRRLGLKISQLALQQKDKEIVQRGPAIAYCYDENGTPTQAALKWAQRCEIELDQARPVSTPKGESLEYRKIIKGEAVEALLPTLLHTALATLPTNRWMNWGDNQCFIRPVHTVTLLLGNDLVPCQLFGIQSDRVIYGHRFIGEAQIYINHATDYPEILLQKGRVIADYAIRKKQIITQLQAAADQLAAKVDLDETLLDEVTNLVEWPVVLKARFPMHFLQIPKEALIYTMKKDQRYFPLYDKKSDALLADFLLVSNIESEDVSKIISGNERVIQARFADAAFFFQTDLAQSFIDYLPQLDQVMFHHKLGSLGEKTRRVRILAGFIATAIGTDNKDVMRAALLAKCDLVTQMVTEFPETQGVMGQYYANKAGEPAVVTTAIGEQYLPRFAGDKLPSSLAACALAIADKLDSLVGIIGIGQKPSGDKDPFALRRAALGIVRIICEKSLCFDLAALVRKAIKGYADTFSNANLLHEVMQFIFTRLKSYLIEQGYRNDTIDAVILNEWRREEMECHYYLNDELNRIKALHHFQKSSSFIPTLIMLNKRIKNVLARVDISKMKNHGDFSIKLTDYIEPEEIGLAKGLLLAQEQWLDEDIDSDVLADYIKRLTHLAEMQSVIAIFFENILVFHQDEKIRHRRIMLLYCLHQLLVKIADFSLLQESPVLSSE